MIKEIHPHFDPQEQQKARDAIEESLRDYYIENLTVEDALLLVPSNR